jgi:flagellar biogenesis protein FliO
MRSILFLGIGALALCAGFGQSAFAQDPPNAQTLEENGRNGVQFGTVPDPPIEGSLPLPSHEAETPPPPTPANTTTGESTANPEWWKETQKALAGAGPASPARPDAETPPVAPRSEMGSQLIRTLSWLLVLCGVIVLGGYLLRRYGKGTPLLAGQHYGQVLAKVYLGPRAALHYVRSGGRVLVIGLTQNQMSLITEFDAEAFEDAQASAPSAESAGPESFLDALRAASKPPTAKAAVPEDDELTSLRGDVQRLQRYLQDNIRETAD